MNSKGFLIGILGLLLSIGGQAQTNILNARTPDDLVSYSGRTGLWGD